MMILKGFFVKIVFQIFVQVVLFKYICGAPVIIQSAQSTDIVIGPCTWVIDRQCPDDDVKFYLYTRNNPQDRQLVYIDRTWEQSNLTSSYFDVLHPVKIVIHGFNSDMFLSSLTDIKDRYLQRGDYNIFYVDWSRLATGPCYLSATHNIRHVGYCIGQLVERIIESGTANIHIIGFSLGAHVPNYIAQSVDSFFIPRITGLDPALPLFMTSPASEKLDPSDAAFVDVIHTNALIQGKIERCGHADFYMNGGILQPGCVALDSNPFACSHHRAPEYFAESIVSPRGFWGWSCDSYINYLLGLCPPTNNLVLSGEFCNSDTEGLFLVQTNGVPPFAQGKWTELDSFPNDKKVLVQTFSKQDPLMKKIDQWGKLEGNFNNIQTYYTTSYLKDSDSGRYPYFEYERPKEIYDKQKFDQTTHRFKIKKNETKNITKGVQNHHITARRKFLEEYKRNLTKGAFSPDIFQLPVVEIN